jgi:predicted esterase
MGELTMKQFEQQFYELCGEGNYPAAYELVTREMGRFPAWAQSSYYNWRMCAACLSGQPDTALAVFEEALAAGHWYDAAGLREDADLATLQGRPEFERLVAISLQRREQARANATPGLELFEPTSGASPYPLLIALHGNHSNLEESAYRWRAAAGKGWLVATLQSSQIMGSGTFGWNDREWALSEVEQHYAGLCQSYPIDANRVVLAGFSMGGGLAIRLALSGAIQARGFVGVGAFLPNIDEIIPLLEAGGGRGRRAYLIGSQRDRSCYAIAERLGELLPQYGIPVEVALHPDLGHDFPPEFERGLLTALDFIMNIG